MRLQRQLDKEDDNADFQPSSEEEMPLSTTVKTKKSKAAIATDKGKAGEEVDPGVGKGRAKARELTTKKMKTTGKTNSSNATDPAAPKTTTTKIKARMKPQPAPAVLINEEDAQMAEEEEMRLEGVEIGRQKGAPFQYAHLALAESYPSVVELGNTKVRHFNTLIWRTQILTNAFVNVGVFAQRKSAPFLQSQMALADVRFSDKAPSRPSNVQGEAVSDETRENRLNHHKDSERLGVRQGAALPKPKKVQAVGSTGECLGNFGI